MALQKYIIFVYCLILQDLLLYHGKEEVSLDTSFAMISSEQTSEKEIVEYDIESLVAHGEGPIAPRGQRSEAREAKLDLYDSDLEIESFSLSDQINPNDEYSGKNQLQGRGGLITKVKKTVKSYFFKGPPCVSQITGRIGICIKEKFCRKTENGHPESQQQGYCNKMHHVCCIAYVTCDPRKVDRSHSGVTYFMNPEFEGHSATTRTCVIKIYRTHQKICQFRVFFETFEISGPTNGDCSPDYLRIDGHNENFEIPKICGINTNHHIIVPVDQTEEGSPIRFTIKTSGGAHMRRWMIRVMQLPCGSKFLAPGGCLKYYLSPIGIMKTFNYGSVNPNEGYFNDLDYAMCIRRSQDNCGVTFISDDFHISNSFPGTSASDAQCSSIDYLQFPPSQVLKPARMCGNVFNPIAGETVPSPLHIQTTTAIIVYFRSINSGSKPRGFSIAYAFKQCS